MNMNLSMKKEFLDLLLSTNRKGVEPVIYGLESTGFFESPASQAAHLAYDGGLVEHSLNVFRIATRIAADMRSAMSWTVYSPRPYHHHQPTS